MKATVLVVLVAIVLSATAVFAENQREISLGPYIASDDVGAVISGKMIFDRDSDFDVPIVFSHIWLDDGNIDYLGAGLQKQDKRLTLVATVGVAWVSKASVQFEYAPNPEPNQNDLVEINCVHPGSKPQPNHPTKHKPHRRHNDTPDTSTNLDSNVASEMNASLSHDHTAKFPVFRLEAIYGLNQDMSWLASAFYQHTGINGTNGVGVNIVHRW